MLYPLLKVVINSFSSGERPGGARDGGRQRDPPICNVCIYIYIYIYTHVLHVCIYIYIYVIKYMYVYIYIYIYIA